MNELGGTLGVLWVTAGFIGALMLLAKGKLRLGVITWILFGWWGMLFLVVLGGGFLLWWGYAADGGRTCPACREKVHSKATVCPHCRTSLVATASA